MTRLCISFSGGRTSARMAKHLMDVADARGSRESVRVVFANTGQEDGRTLDFVDQCDKAWSLGVVWVEADVDPAPGVGTSYKIVTYETASRNGEPFEAVIQKYGIPNRNYPNCTRELKERAITSYLRSLGWKSRTYDTAIGLRVDEMDRMNSKAKALRIIYPLVKLGIRKADILSWWAHQPFDLRTPEHWGNCVTCWKKSDRKLMTLAREDASRFDFFKRMEATYPDAGPGDEQDRPRRFFRGARSCGEIIAAANRPFVPFVEGDLQLEMDMMDLGGGCGESCEVFTDAEAA